jgi:hypothetical protein
MGKSGGSGGGSSIFTTNITGPPPGPSTVGADAYISLGTIPTGQRVWFGSAQYASPDKSITFEVRTNNIGQSTGSDSATSLLASTAVVPRSGLLNVDYYKKGQLHITSVTGTGVESFWLRLKSKSGAVGEYFFSMNYTVE